jgi:hypothetical protein
MVLRRAGYSPVIVTRPDMPTGPYYRIADNTKLAQRTGWHPKTTFAEGISPSRQFTMVLQSEAKRRFVRSSPPGTQETVSPVAGRSAN